MTVNSTTRSASTSAVSRPSTSGSAEIRSLQDKLRAAGFDPGKSDGVMGKNTREALKAFQASQGLKSDGVFGKDTKKAVNALPTPAKAAATEKPAAKTSDGFTSSLTKNKDGSTTLKQTEVDGKKTTTTASTSNKKWNGAEEYKLETKTTTAGKGTNSKELTEKFERKTDAFGRATTTRTDELATKRGQTTTTKGTVTTTDFKGNTSVAKSNAKSVEKGDTTKSTSTVTTESDNKFGPVKFSTNGTTTESKKAVKNGDTTVTTTKKETTGTDFKLSHSSEIKDGKFTLKDSGDWKKHSFNKEVGKEKEWKLKDVKPDEGFSTKKQDGVHGKLDKAQIAGDVLGAAGLKTTAFQGAKWDNVNLKELSDEKKHFVGSKVGTTGDSSVSIGANGVDAKFKREASAGLYAQHNDSVTGAHGTASYQAGAKVEARAGVDAQGKLNLNGLDASVNAKVGVSAEASVTGKLESNAVKIGGVDMKASVEGTATVKAEAEAHANATVKITRNPPAVVATGEVGASAVVKAEGSVKASAGPFSVKASGYGSAGAEAKASGTIGYQDGKLKLGGSLGAAVGLGLGGAVEVEVDVEQIGTAVKNTAVAAGQAAHKAADQNGDGKLGLDDISAGASNAASAAKSAVSSAASTVRSWLPW